MKLINPDKLELLNKGLEESSNLMEALAIDFSLLFEILYPNHSIDFNKIKGITKKMNIVASHIVAQNGYNDVQNLISHKSDMVRGWGCYVIGISEYDLANSLELIRPMADDHNSGVREWAWLALRNKIQYNIEKSIELLLPWTQDQSPNIRRFASEITRPRGVWSAHIPKLKQNPSLGLSLLNELNKDPAKYVQNSVGNWLNDASKDNKLWVTNICQEWESLNNSNTLKIIKRALRNNLQK